MLTALYGEKRDASSARFNNELRDCPFEQPAITRDTTNNNPNILYLLIFDLCVCFGFMVVVFCWCCLDVCCHDLPHCHFSLKVTGSVKQTLAGLP